jgi:Glutathione S-transferase, C-terminal domain
MPRPSERVLSRRRAQTRDLHRLRRQGLVQPGSRTGPAAIRCSDRSTGDMFAFGFVSASMTGYLPGEKPSSIDANIYGFIANIYFYDIETPLKQFVVSH